MEFKVGDRVRWAYDGEEGTVISLVSNFGEDSAEVEWDVEGPAINWVGNLELVEDQSNRTYYSTADEFAESVRKFATTQVSADDILKVGIVSSRGLGNTPVDPDHYKFPGGAEVIHISQWLTANSSQALQYIARSSRIDGKNKGDASEDIRKAITFLEFELKRLESE